jgi:hypothetical protein
MVVPCGLAMRLLRSTLTESLKSLSSISGPTWISMGVGLIVAVAGYFIVLQWGAAIILHLASKLFLGKEMTLTEALQKGFKQLLSLVWGSVLLILITLGLLLPIVLFTWGLIVGAKKMTTTTSTALYWTIGGAIEIALITLLLFFLTSYLLYYIVIVLEDLKGTKSFTRSHRLLLGDSKNLLHPNIWRFSIVWTVTILIQWFFIAIGYMCNLFFDHLVFKTALLDAVKDSGNRMMVFDLFFQAAATPFGIIVLMLFYYDLRIRNEAFDVKLRAGIF